MNVKVTVFVVRMNLEAKLLDGKNVGYCSSSDGEGDDAGGWKVAKDEDEHQRNVWQKMGGGGAQTGAKGVMEDFKHFREEVRFNREQQRRDVRAMAERGMLERSKEEREKAQAEESEEEEDSLESLRARRLKEMRKAAAGKLVEITEKDHFTAAIDSCGSGLLCVLIYEPEREECERATHVVKMLASDYPRVRFVRVRSEVLGMTKNFTAQALPTLQFYLNGNLIGNFIQLTSLVGMDYDHKQLRKFLKKQHISLDGNCYLTDTDESTDED